MVKNTPAEEAALAIARKCSAHYIPEQCPLILTFYRYVPDPIINMALFGLFTAMFLAFVVQGLKWRSQLGSSYSWAMMLGCLTIMIGYGGRLMMFYNPFSEMGFIIQLSALTMGPVFFSAGIYVCLSKIVVAFGPEHSRISPGKYMAIFIPCDVISLVFQGAGGGISSIALDKGEYSEAGNTVLLVGLVTQIISLVVFFCLSLDYAYQTWRRMRTVGLDSRALALTQNTNFKLFISALVLSAICILIRSGYRMEEKRGGWTGPMMRDQFSFIVFEGVLIAAACLGMTIFHPGRCLMKPQEQLSNRKSRMSYYPKIVHRGDKDWDESKMKSFEAREDGEWDEGRGDQAKGIYNVEHVDRHHGWV